VVWDFVAAHLQLLGELSGLLAVIAAVIVVAAVAISRFDGVPFEDAMYLAFITAFTVGFGDVTPRSRGARIASIVLAFLGLVLVGVLVAVAVHALGMVLRDRGI
jgi:voltage-gated potassium channel